MEDIALDISITDEAIDTEILLNEETIDLEVSVDTSVSINPYPDLAFGGSDFVA